MKKTDNFIEQIINEATGGGGNAPGSPSVIINVADSPLTKAIKTFFIDNKDAQLDSITQNGDLYTIDVRIKLPEESLQMQSQRELAKTKSFEIKDALKEALSKEFNIPTFSLAGLRLPALNIAEFEINCTYANKGNLKPTYESTKPKAKTPIELIIESALSDDSTEVAQEELTEKTKAVVEAALKAPDKKV